MDRDGPVRNGELRRFASIYRRGEEQRARRAACAPHIGITFQVHKRSRHAKFDSICGSAGGVGIKRVRKEGNRDPADTTSTGTGAIDYRGPGPCTCTGSSGSPGCRRSQRGKRGTREGRNCSDSAACGTRQEITSGPRRCMARGAGLKIPSAGRRFSLQVTDTSRRISHGVHAAQPNEWHGSAYLALDPASGVARYTLLRRSGRPAPGGYRSSPG